MRDRSFDPIDAAINDSTEDLRHRVVAIATLEQCLLGMAILGLVALLSLPTLRWASHWFGWTPLWLLLLPGMAWWVACNARRRALAALAAGARRRPVRMPRQPRAVPLHRDQALRGHGVRLREAVEPGTMEAGTGRVARAA